MIKEPTYLLQNSQPNIVSESCHPNCHHLIVFCHHLIPSSSKFNLKICHPPPYLTEVWYYEEANNDLIKRAINNFNWEKAFYKANINKKVSLFSKTILNVPNNYIPHETIICDDKYLPWFNSRIKSLMENKNKLRKNYRRFKSNRQLLNKPNLLQEQLHFLIKINQSKLISQE